MILAEEQIKQIAIDKQGLIMIEINGLQYIVQAYLKGEFVHLTNKITSIRIRFDNKELSSWGKQDKVWKDLSSKINISDIQQNLESIFKEINN